MKVTVERSELLRSLGHVHRVVERRNTIPILANVLVRADRAKLALKATDLDLEVIDAVAAEVGPGGADHGPRPYVLRHRAQAARGRPGRARIFERPRGTVDPRRPFALHAADAPGKRFSRSRAGRDDPQIRAQGRRSQAADRQDAVRHLDRRDRATTSTASICTPPARPRRRRCARSRPTATAWRRSRSTCRTAPPECPASSFRARPSARCSASSRTARRRWRSNCRRGRSASRSVK